MLHFWFFGVACGLSSLWLSEIQQPRCVIASVCQKRTVVGGEVLEDGCTLAVADLSFSMEFGIQDAFCSSYKTWRIPFLSRLAAVR